MKNVMKNTYNSLRTSKVGQEILLSRWNFNRRRKAYFATHPINSEVKFTDDALNSLIQNGIVVLPGYFNRKIAEEIHDSSRPILEDIRNGQSLDGLNTVTYPEDGIYRLKNIGGTIPQSKSILDDQRINNIVSLYLGGEYRTKSNYIDYKPDIGRHDYTTVPHMDTWLSQIKVFTLLSDVNIDNAPLVYWKKSHFDREWRRELDYLNFSQSTLGSSGVIPPSIIRACAKKEYSDIEELVATGTAGTVIIADVRGAHRASNLLKGYRLEIVQKFNPLVR